MSYNDLYQEVRFFGGEKDGEKTKFSPTWKKPDILFSLPLEDVKSVEKMFIGPDRIAAEVSLSRLAYKYCSTAMSESETGDLFYVHRYDRAESFDR